MENSWFTLYYHCNIYIISKQMCTILCSVGSRFSDYAHYNEFVENGSKSWILMRQRLVLGGEKYTESDSPTSQGERTLRLRTGTPNSSHIPGASLLSLGLLLLPPSPCFGWSLLLYIPLFCSSSFYTCQSSMPILECTSHQPLFLALCELLWPPSHCPRVTSTSMESGC